jgi:hypothetical protein
VQPVQPMMLRSVHFALLKKASTRSLLHVLRAHLYLLNVPVGPLTTVLVLSPVTPPAKFAPKVLMQLLPVLSLIELCVPLLTLRMPGVPLQSLANAPGTLIAPKMSTVRPVMVQSQPIPKTKGPE